MTNKPSYQQLEERIASLESQLHERNCDLKSNALAKEERLRFSLEANQDGIWDFDAVENTIHYTDFWQILGYDFKQRTFDCSYWLQYINPSHLYKLSEIVQKCFTDSGSEDYFSVEVQMLTRDGQWRWILSKGKVISRDSNGKALRVIGTHRDVSDRKNNELILEQKVEGLTCANESDHTVSFAQLFNTNEIQTLQEQFAIATGVGSLINNADGTPATKPSQFKSYCQLIRSSKEGNERCINSDLLIAQEQNKNGSEIAIRRCHSGGLFDASASISINNKLIANWMIGQVRDADNLLSDKWIKEYAAEIGIDGDKLLAAYNKLPIMSKGKFEDICNAQYELAKILSKTAYQTFNQARMIDKLENLEEKANVANKKLLGLFAASNDPIFMRPYHATEFTTFTEVNQAACVKYGHSQEEFYQLTPIDIISTIPKNTAQVKWNIENLRELKELTYECIHVTKDGTTFPIEAHLKLIELEGQEIIVSIVRDLSAQKEAQRNTSLLEKQLNQAQKLESVGRLAGGIAHDFNNMLSVIQGHAELAQEFVPDTDPIHFDLKQIQEAALHSSKLTKQLLAFARQEPIVPVVVDINTTIHRTLDMLTRLIDSKKTISWKPQKDLQSIKIDPNQLTQILTNLCVNASDAIAEDGSIMIETSNVIIEEEHLQEQGVCTPGNYVLISVCDTGHGIDKEILPLIFEPFYTTKKVGKGTGLGLSTVYGIIKQNRGFITAESELGVGTCFKIFIPSVDSEGDTDIADEIKSVSLKKNDTTILIVDDKKEIITMIAQILKIKGYKTFVASSPMEAINIAKTHKESINLLITDIIMPHMNGKELKDEIVKIIPGIKTLFMSGFTSNIIEGQSIKESEFNFISKPFSRDSLYDKVANILNS